jgi:hypothetical protein
MERVFSLFFFFLLRTFRKLVPSYYMLNGYQRTKLRFMHIKTCWGSLAISLGELERSVEAGAHTERSRSCGQTLGGC